MNEKLPILRQAIQELKKEQATEYLADELATLVEELSAQLEKKELVAIQASEEKITQFLADHETEITIGDWQEELTTLKGTISSGTDKQQKNKKQSSRRGSLRGTDESEEEPKEDDDDDSESPTHRRQHPRAKALGLSLVIGGIYMYTTKAKHMTHMSKIEPVASGVNYEKASPEQKRSMCYQYLQQIGFSKILAAGIVGNIDQESKFDTNAIGDDGVAHGLCQRRDGRRENLQNFCASPAGKGREIDDYTLQLDFIKFELEGKEREAFTYLKKAKTPTEAAELFVTHYERAGDPHTENRITSANTVFAQDTRNLT